MAEATPAIAPATRRSTRGTAGAATVAKVDEDVEMQVCANPASFLLCASDLLLGIRPNWRTMTGHPAKTTAQSSHEGHEKHDKEPHAGLVRPPRFFHPHVSSLIHRDRHLLSAAKTV